MTRLSVNINKIATIRNARGGNIPDVLKAARCAQEFGAQGITVHPRPDERHITYRDAMDLRAVVNTEFNIEGNPTPTFVELVKRVRPEQVTLVPDAPDVLTSNAGWDTINHAEFLSKVIADLKEWGMRVSIFVDPDPQIVEGAAKVGADRVELYTEAYARIHPTSPEEAIEPYRIAALRAKELGLMVNAGHDLDLNNLTHIVSEIPFLAEVSIGHALISDALYLGLEETIRQYLGCIAKGQRLGNK
ncbi:MAG: pyridoxine 5'-phosphate synthase [Bacteroidetes bacterium]|nr:MAG: pyridoxine 5'-phosphate synthase [Bacteroidota bacterium]